MNIDPHSETLIRLGEVPRLRWLPGRRAGKRLHVATIHRWAQDGLHGRRLETVRVGGALATTEAALMRFFAALSSAGDGPPARTAARRTRDVRAAEAAMTAAGI